MDISQEILYTPSKEWRILNEFTQKNSHNIGVLFIIATTFLFVGGSFYGPVLDTLEYLQVAYPNRITATVGMLIEFSCIITILLIPIAVQEMVMALWLIIKGFDQTALASLSKK